MRPTIALFLSLSFVPAVATIPLSYAGEVSPPADPEHTAGPGLDLASAVRLALERNPGIESERAAARQGSARAREAAAARWPRLLMDAGWHTTDNPVRVFGDKLTAGEFAADDFLLDNLNHPDSIDHAQLGVDLEVPLFTSGRIRHGMTAAQEVSAAAGARLSAAEADLILRVTEAYYGAILARAAVGVAENALRNAQAHEEVAAARLEAGSALRSDRLRAEIERLTRTQELERRRADLEIARARLRLIVGAARGEAIEPSAELAAPAGGIDDLGAWLERALRDRPEIEAARRQTAAAGASSRATRAALGPEAFGAARYERNASGWDAGEGSYSVGLGLRWPAFDAARPARIDAAGAGAAAAVARERAVIDAVQLEVEAAWHDARVSGTNLSTARRAVEAADEARRISAERYAAGLLPLTDLLETETSLVVSRQAELAALSDAILGRARLLRAAGVVEVQP